ncbi:hypothetical protein AW736_16895 [Termitidicoccus mucosus]|uniref:Lipocalin-like domain-containing protein n=3 Tax=Termitidicoccus mucosus TaxID=1184151 RepID=A0A178IEU7_9BACT|nr:hypothetical protein AW736_16895 [Opitutaceae bacterium TSB47]
MVSLDLMPDFSLESWMRNIIILTILAVSSGMGACASKQPVDAAHHSRNSLDWAGVYTGEIPSASGSGINVTLTLRSDSTYTLRYRYAGRLGADFGAAGTFKWDNGNTITLDAKDAPAHYQVGENRLIQLDMKGKIITGMLADSYVLRKQP